MGSSERRGPVTVALLSGEDHRHLKDALVTLERQLLVGDNVVVISPAGRLDTPAAWREQRGHGGLQKVSKLPRLRDLVLVLDDRCVLEDGVLDALVSAIAPAKVAAVGALSNIADGDDLYLGSPYLPGDHGARRAFVRTLARSNAGVTTAETLGGPCVLVRRPALEAGGGLDALAAGTGLSAALEAAKAKGAQLRVARSAYVHHPGGPPRQVRSPAVPLLSACLIVRDEEHQLSTCLASASALADEIVLYDTGSLDGTVALARELGARVSEGYWDDDFGRARNEALSHCRGQWILWLDADETLVCEDPELFRRQLAAAPADVESLLLLIDNLQGTEAGTSMAHPAARVFRRGRCHWEGRLHEQVVRRQGRPDPTGKLLEHPRISHRGYLRSTISNRDKAARNLRSAFGDLASGAELDQATRVLSLGRSYLLSGRFEEGIELCRRALELSERASTARLALRGIGDGLVSLGRCDEALEAVERLRSITKVPVLAEVIEGRARLAMGDPNGALAAFGRVRQVIDDDGFQYGASLVADGKASALVALGRHGEAADVLLETLRESGGLDTHLGLLVESLESAGRSPAEIYDAFDPSRLLAFVPQVLQLNPDAADRVLEAWIRRDPTCLPLLAAAARIAPRLGISRQLHWSVRLRTAGQSLSCPLISAAVSPETAPRERVLAASVGWASFADIRAELAFGPAVLAVSAEERVPLRAELAALAPQLLERFDALVPSPSAASPGGVEDHRRLTADLGDSGPRQVLVIARHNAALRPAALAAALSAAGHPTVLAHPQPAKASEELLAHLGIEVAGWLETDLARWEPSCLALVARVSAVRAIDSAVLTPGTETLEEPLRRLLPGSEILRDDGAAFLPLDPLFGATGPLGQSARRGVLVAASLRSSQDSLSAPLDRLLCALREALPGRPLAHVGDDPANLVAKAHPEVVGFGPSVDQSPLVRAAEALVITDDPAAEWLQLARACGTPAVAVRADEDPHAAALRLAAILSGQASGDVPSCLSPLSDVSAGPLPRLGGAAARPKRRIRRTQRSGTVSVALVDPAAGGTPDHGFAGTLALAAARGAIDLVADARLADVELRLGSPPAFEPTGERRIVFLPRFAGGALPAEWVGPLRDLGEECWVPSAWASERAVESGIPEPRLHVVSPGLDLERFSPKGPRADIQSARRTKVLFAGPLSEESGVDALLECWLNWVDTTADACLVVDPLDVPEPCPDSAFERSIRKVIADAGESVLLLEPSRQPAAKAALYRACDVLVHPYRADPDARIVAEAMACGLPVVLVEGSAGDHLVDASNGWKVPSRRAAASIPGWTPTPAGFFWSEPSRQSLGASLIQAITDPDARAARGERARSCAAGLPGLQAAADRVAKRIAAVAGNLATGGERELP